MLDRRSNQVVWNDRCSPTDDCDQVALSSDGSTVATSSVAPREEVLEPRQTLVVRDVATGRRILEDQVERATSIALDRSGSKLAYCGRDTCTLRNLRGQGSIVTPPCEPNASSAAKGD